MHDPSENVYQTNIRTSSIGQNFLSAQSYVLKKVGDKCLVSDHHTVVAHGLHWTPPPDARVTSVFKSVFFCSAGRRARRVMPARSSGRRKRGDDTADSTALGTDDGSASSES